MGEDVLKLYVSCHTFKNALCRIFIQATVEPNGSLVNTDINNQKSRKTYGIFKFRQTPKKKPIFKKK